MDRSIELYFRDRLRDARASVLSDAEGFLDALFALERLGAFCIGRRKSLAAYKRPLIDLASKSPLAERIPRHHPGVHTSFPTLLEHVQHARNEALHQGAYARHLATNLVLTCMVLEDALVNGADRISDFSVRSPVCAEPWQPLSLVRQQMLASSFSFLPIRIDLGAGEEWRVISDLALARILRVQDKDREERLAAPIREAMQRFGLELAKPQTVPPDTSVESVLGGELNGLPVLIVDANSSLLGIVTPFDLL